MDHRDQRQTGRHSCEWQDSKYSGGQRMVIHTKMPKKDQNSVLFDSMTHHSPAVILAWKIAAFEALHAHSEFIEKEHLLIGLYSIEKVLSLADFHRNPKIARAILEEKDALEFPLRQSGMDAMVFRRRVRHALPKGYASYGGAIIHRSSRCRECFRRAALLSNGKEVTCIQVLNAILEDPGEIIGKVINDGTAGVDQVRPVSTRMLQSLHQFTKGREQKERLVHEIEHTRHTLALAPRDSAESGVLKLEILKKTLFLARICLDIHDIGNLLVFLKELNKDAGVSPCILENVIGQLEYLQKEGIYMETRSCDLIRTILDNIEHGIRRR